MAGKILGVFLLTFIALFAVFAFSFEYITVADNDNEVSIENSARNAMTQAINLGNARVMEELTINEDIAVEAVLRHYADSSDFYDSDRYVNVYEVNSNPPLLAVESFASVHTPIQEMLNNFSGENTDSETVTRSREVIIYEAKDLSR